MLGRERRGTKKFRRAVSSAEVLDPDFPLGAHIALFASRRRIVGHFCSPSLALVANSSLFAPHSQRNRLEECLEKCIHHRRKS